QGASRPRSPAAGSRQKASGRARSSELLGPDERVQEVYEERHGQERTRGVDDAHSVRPSREMAAISQWVTAYSTMRPRMKTKSTSTPPSMAAGAGYATVGAVSSA